MPEVLNNRQVFSLFEVASSIQKTIADRYKSQYWIKAEMNKLNFYQQSGHCFPELVEKKDGKVIAQLKANLWRDDFTRINNQFKQVLNEPLKDGIKVLFLGSITFHPEHGLSLRIHDIDPAFTLGDLELEKQETIRKLREEGIFKSNKSLKFPLLPQRIAIISVQSSKGYADFLQILEGAERIWGYKFFHLLFPSLLQSDKAVPDMIRQLRRIKKVISHFDVVAIIRGGGGDIGLSCYNQYELAREIAAFPIPVLTGIGHATNETVSEMVAFENAITPTKLAEELIQKFHNFLVPVQKAQEKIVDQSKRLLADERSAFLAETKLFRSVTRNLIGQHKADLKENAYSLRKDTQALIKQETGLISRTVQQLTGNVRLIFKTHSADLINLEKNVANMSPLNVLKRGYSISLINGKPVTTHKKVSPGDILNTVLFDGHIISTVNTSSKKNPDE
jgi:exodeoxyribonuclease VII large subunit